MPHSVRRTRDAENLKVMRLEDARRYLLKQAQTPDFANR